MTRWPGLSHGWKTALPTSPTRAIRPVQSGANVSANVRIASLRSSIPSSDLDDVAGAGGAGGARHRAIVQKAGLPETASWHVITGGAEANYTALICALTRACPGLYFMARGRSAAIRRSIYAGIHLAWLKIAHSNTYS